MTNWFKKEKINATLRNLSVTVLVILFILIILSNRIFVTIKPGEAGVLYDLFKGSQPEVYTEGLKMISPLNKMYIYNLRTQRIQQQQTILSQNGLKIKVKYNILYRPDFVYLSKLHQQIGPNYAQVLVIPEAESWTRKFIAHLTPEQIFLVDKGVDHDSMEKYVISNLNAICIKNNINLQGYLISRIELPDTISHSIEQKYREQQLSLQYDFKLDVEDKERKRKIIEAEGVKQFYAISGVSPLLWKGLDVTEKMSRSPNAKIVIMGNSSKELPILLSDDGKKK